MTMTDRNRESRLDLEHELPASDDTQAETGSPDVPPQAESAEPAEPAEPEVDKLKAERNALFDRLARLQAEFDNFRKRQAKENQDFRDYALNRAILGLLPIVDSFDRALQTPDSAEFRKGVELINRQFHDALTKMGVEPIQTAGQPFDPNVHQAVQTVESKDVPENHVVNELQRGYKLKDRLLRPAMVTVAK
jgi:molecular chaperone GrpE